jgi:hypothetical protein
VSRVTTVLREHASPGKIAIFKIHQFSMYNYHSSTYLSDMDSMFFTVAVARRDAGVEPAGTYSRRAIARNIEFMFSTELGLFWCSNDV